VDLITAIVDDPYTFGMIATANSLSDVYAMGAKPVTALSIVTFPSDTMDIAIMTQILKGALEKLNEAEVIMVGGHSVRNEELKFGLCITGTVHPDKVITKSSARAGDNLIITKPLGIGILNTALKAGRLEAGTQARMIQQMIRLNTRAAAIMTSMGVNAATDITGFGLIGHACEMAENSGVAIEIACDKVPFIEKALGFAGQGFVPEGMFANLEFRVEMLKKNQTDEDMLAVLCDPQTSGGLLISVAAEKAEVMLSRIRQAGDREAAIIGRVLDKPKSQIILV
jgi:selenide,water dikinase